MQNQSYHSNASFTRHLWPQLEQLHIDFLGCDEQKEIEKEADGTPLHVELN